MGDRKWAPARIFVVGFGALIATSLVARSGAAADQEQVLYSFCSTGGLHCTDGAFPEAGLIMDKSGNLYGTTSSGGAHGKGEVFELTPNTAKTAWAHKVLYSFCAQGGESCTDGSIPHAGLIMDASGNLYGTTIAGGTHNQQGTAFELTPNAAKTAWAHKVLYSFCAQTGCADGSQPTAGLIMDTSGNLYGTTSYGGAYYENGTVFELAPNAAKTAWAYKVLYNFCAQTNCADGSTPGAGLLIDKLGNLYGTTVGGGAHFVGTVFELTPNAAKTAWAQEVLYSFCAQPSCTDGDNPQAGLIMDASGNLYGTTVAGGGAYDSGTVFELAPNAAKTAWTHKVLYSFCTQGGSCTDGARPEAGLMMDKSGNLYGTTYWGAAHGDSGTVFELMPNAAKTAWAYKVLYSFCAQTGCTDGGNPVAGLITDASGNLYGTTSGGGTHGSGIAFELKPEFKITVEASPAADGTVSGGGTFAEGCSCTVTATPKSGFRFVHWTESGKVVSTSEKYTFKLEANVTLIAEFEKSKAGEVIE